MVSWSFAQCYSWPQGPNLPRRAGSSNCQKLHSTRQKDKMWEVQTKRLGYGETTWKDAWQLVGRRTRADEKGHVGDQAREASEEVHKVSRSRMKVLDQPWCIDSCGGSLGSTYDEKIGTGHMVPISKGVPFQLGEFSPPRSDSGTYEISFGATRHWGNPSQWPRTAPSTINLEELSWAETFSWIRFFGLINLKLPFTEVNSTPVELNTARRIHYPSPVFPTESDPMLQGWEKQWVSR